MIPVRALLMAVAMIVACGVPFSASADTVYMKSGETINGKIVEETPGQFLRIRVGSGATWVLYFSQINHVERDGQQSSRVQSPAPTPKATPTPAPMKAKEQSTSEDSSSVGQNSNTTSIQPEAVTTEAPAYVPFRRESSGSGSYPRVNIGIVIGPDFFHEYESLSMQSDASDAKTGVVAGGIFEIAPSAYFSIQPGLCYSMRGASYSGGSDEFSYLSIPIDLKLKLPVEQALSLYFIGGVNFGFLMSATSAGVDLSNYMNMVDFGLDFGAGLEFPTGNITPFVEFVYYDGILDISNQQYKEILSAAIYQETGESVTLNSIVNGGFELRAGLKFKL